jgi:hypothetical protein
MALQSDSGETGFGYVRTAVHTTVGSNRTNDLSLGSGGTVGGRSHARLTRIYVTSPHANGWARIDGLKFPILPIARPCSHHPFSVASTSSSDDCSAMSATRSPT